jgi:hypothetical protein
VESLGYFQQKRFVKLLQKNTPNNKRKAWTGFYTKRKVEVWIIFSVKNTNIIEIKHVSTNAMAYCSFR